MWEEELLYIIIILLYSIILLHITLNHISGQFLFLQKPVFIDEVFLDSLHVIVFWSLLATASTDTSTTIFFSTFKN